jgi:hypothetical protein
VKLIPFYKELLSLGFLSADEEGYISAEMAGMPGMKTPFLLEGKRFVLPTQKQLSNPDKREVVIFHPLQENSLKGESDIMAKYRWAVNVRLNYVLGSICEELLNIVVSPKLHAKLSPDQALLLTSVKNADEKTLTSFRAILKNMGIGNKDKCLVYIFLRRGTTVVREKKYSRAAVVWFPLLDELLKDDKQVFGVTLRTKDRAAIIQLLEFVLPGITTKGHFDKGSESDIAPFLDSLLLAVLNLAGPINTLLTDYQDFLDKPEELEYTDAWLDTFENMSALLPEIRSIPMQTGNDGNVAKPVVAPPTLQQMYQQPMPQQLSYPTHPQQNNWMSPQQPVQQQPAITETGKLDFATMMRNNPSIAATVSFNNQQQFPGMMQQGPETPRWAQPQMNPMMGGFPQGNYPMMGGGYNGPRI